MTRKRIEWTTYEQGQIYAATLDLLKGRKVILPIATAKGRQEFLRAIRDAQVALPENRRRKYLLSIEAITGDLLHRFINTNILPTNLSSLKRGRASQGPAVADPRDQRIVDLMAQLEAAQAQIRELQALSEQHRARIAQLEARPSPAQMMQEFVADTLALALQKAGDANKPFGVRLPGGAGAHPKL